MMDELHFLFSDSLHINRKNFGPLFAMAEARKIRVTVHGKDADLKRAVGLYTEDPRLTAQANGFAALDAEALLTAEHMYGSIPLRLFPLCRAEMLAYALARYPALHEAHLERDDAALLDKLRTLDGTMVARSFAATCFWIDTFGAAFAGGTYSHVFLFGGSLIYTRVLMELARRSRTKSMVLESSFTGNQFYCEERYLPLAASPDIRLPAVRHGYAALLREPEHVGARERVDLRMLEARNKNVVQPKVRPQVSFAEPSRPTLLVVGQVVNDFSIIEQRNCPLSSLAFYKTLIQRSLAETEYNVIFKAHPWERRKVHLERPMTLEYLQAFAKELPAEHQRRLLLVSDENMQHLGRMSDRVALLNSQSGLELAYQVGLRPSTFGDPYYAHFGFTDDYGSIDAFLADIQAGGVRRYLDLEAFDQLKTFLAMLLELHCATNSRRELATFERKIPFDTASALPRRMEGVPGIGDWATLRAKGKKFLRDPKRFVRDSPRLRKLLDR